ncbi:TPA: hypothetical protein HA231_05040 [Candidatus Woesearchaeota archaeon]|nr:hypothetical protein [Candidatus Woesearchaeota archaeon]
MKPIKKALVVYFTKYYSSFLKARKALEKVMTVYSTHRENEKYIKKMVGKVDAVLVVGGDGTLLRASHFIEKTPVLHISSGTDSHEAFYARASEKDIRRKAKLLAEGEYKTTPLMRLESTLNGKKIPYKALNEVFAGGKKPYHTARCLLIVGSRKEEQKSSGIIISTPTGSYAWARSAGGKLLQQHENKMQFIVREPYTGRIARPKMTRGITSSPITLDSKIWHAGIVVVDSYQKEFPFNKGSKLVVKKAKQPFNLISF